MTDHGPDGTVPPSPFSVVLDSIRDRVENGLDDVIACVGYEGSGKSTLAQWLGLALDPDFGQDRVLHGAHDLIKSTTLRPGAVRVWDEALLGAFGRRSSSTENVSTVLMLSLGRMRRVVTVLCAADLSWLDPYLRQHRVRRLFVCHGGGLATYHLRLRNPGDPDFPFAPLFSIRYPVLPPDWWEEYESHKARSLAKVEKQLIRDMERKQTGKKGKRGKKSGVGSDEPDDGDG